MPGPTVTFGPLTTTTFALLIASGVIGATLTLTVRYHRQTGRSPLPALDSALVAVVVALVLGRAGHVGLNWDYFQAYPAEITQLRAGGLAWQVAYLGAWGTAWAMLRWRGGVQPARLLDALAWWVPGLALLAWWGCGAAHCAYGQEVITLADYPGWLAWEDRDLTGIIAPRFAVQPLGMAGAMLAMLLVWLAARRGWFPGQRVAWAGLLVAWSAFVLGFLRGDPAGQLAGLRLDQWLDAAVMIVCISVLFASRSSPTAT
jgi:prolipoprotein diacylglyceryltransferase